LAAAEAASSVICGALLGARPAATTAGREWSGTSGHPPRLEPRTGPPTITSLVIWEGTETAPFVQIVRSSCTDQVPLGWRPCWSSRNFRSSSVIFWPRNWRGRLRSRVTHRRFVSGPRYAASSARRARTICRGSRYRSRLPSSLKLWALWQVTRRRGGSGKPISWAQPTLTQRIDSIEGSECINALQRARLVRIATGSCFAALAADRGSLSR
jgi:hypothetical protein